VGEGWPGSRRALGFSALRADAAPCPPWHAMQLCTVPSVPADGGRGWALEIPSRDPLILLLSASPSPESQARHDLGKGAPAHGRVMELQFCGCGRKHCKGSLVSGADQSCMALCPAPNSDLRQMPREECKNRASVLSNSSSTFLALSSLWSRRFLSQKWFVDTE